MRVLGRAEMTVTDSTDSEHSCSDVRQPPASPRVSPHHLVLRRFSLKIFPSLGQSQGPAIAHLAIVSDAYAREK